MNSVCSWWLAYRHLRQGQPIKRRLPRRKRPLRGCWRGRYRSLFKGVSAPRLRKLPPVRCRSMSGRRPVR